MVPSTVLQTTPAFYPTPAVTVAFTWDPSQGDFQSQTVPNGTTITRPSDGTQWTVQESYPYTNNVYDRIQLVVALLTPPTDPIQRLAVNDAINIG